MTNRERLRAMSGRELASWILGMVEDDGFCTGCPATGICRLNWQNETWNRGMVND